MSEEQVYSEIARKLASHDALVEALETIRTKAAAGERGLAHQVFKISDAALKSSRGDL